jgi:hypothetical protein
MPSNDQYDCLSSYKSKSTDPNKTNNRLSNQSDAFESNVIGLDTSPIQLSNVGLVILPSCTKEYKINTKEMFDLTKRSSISKEESKGSMY